jgi:hypothetical protein
MSRVFRRADCDVDHVNMVAVRERASDAEIWPRKLNSSKVYVQSEAFTATDINKILSGYRPSQFVKNRRFGDQLSSPDILMMMMII